MSDNGVHALIEWMYSARLMSEKAGLNNMRALCKALDHPERAFRAVHVAGTNGKGSVCAFIERALRENGLRTGLYTSPYLIHYNERIQFSGTSIADDALLRAGARVRQAAEQLASIGVRPTTFELGTALAFCAFEEHRVDIAVIETGIGGLTDATNVIASEVAVIATIGLDHIELLGDTLVDIARIKAGILKRGALAAFYPHPAEVCAVLDEAAAKLDVPVLHAQDHPMHAMHTDPYGSDFSIDLPPLGALDIRINLPGAHQIENARLALAALTLLAKRGLQLDARAVERGLARTVWPGRLEWVEPNLLLDGAHNPQGARALTHYLDQFFRGREVVLLTAMMRDKQPDAYADQLAPYVKHAVTTRVDWPRSLGADALAALYRARGVVSECCPDVSAALECARSLAGHDALIVVAGSLYLIGEVRTILQQNRVN